MLCICCICGYICSVYALHIYIYIYIYIYIDKSAQAGLTEAVYVNQQNADNKALKPSPPKRKPRLDVNVLNEVVIKNKIRTNDELVFFNKKQSMESKRHI